MRRRVLTILALLVAGAVVNVAVAWGCAIPTLGQTSPMDRSPVNLSWTVEAETNLESWYIRTRTRFGARRAEAINFAMFPTPPVQVPSDTLPPWSQIKQLPKIEHHMSSKIYVDAAYGWPCLCLWEPRARGGGFEMAAGPKLWRWRVPVLPIWRGFAANMLFYAAILWLLIGGPFALRRIIRRRRGLCPACGYDVKHAEHESCPECGASTADRIGGL